MWPHKAQIGGYPGHGGRWDGARVMVGEVLTARAKCWGPRHPKVVTKGKTPVDMAHCGTSIELSFRGPKKVGPRSHMSRDKLVDEGCCLMIQIGVDSQQQRRQSNRAMANAAAAAAAAAAYKHACTQPQTHAHTHTHAHMSIHICMHMRRIASHDFIDCCSHKILKWRRHNPATAPGSGLVRMSSRQLAPDGVKAGSAG